MALAITDDCSHDPLADLDALAAPLGLDLFDRASFRTRARVDAARCTGCGDCADACAFDAIARAKGAGGVALVLEPRCVACGQCELECTRGAIALVRPGAAPAVSLAP